MDWDDLKVFLAIARSGSVRGAANRIGVSHSTVLRRLDALEDALGVALFLRLTTGYTLTEEATGLLTEVEEIERGVLAFERGAIGGDRESEGRVRVTMPEPFMTHFLAHQIAAHRSSLVGLEVDCVFTYDILDLSRRDADVAIRFSNEPDGALIGRPLPHFAESHYALPSYLEAHSLKGDDASAVWLGWRQTNEWVQESPYPDLVTRWRVPNLTVQHRLCRDGVAMAQLPCFIGDRDQQLVRVPGAKTINGTDAWVVYHPDLKGTTRIQKFSEFVVSRAAANADLIEGRLPRV